ncbi:hypothetical protein C8A03DRAFT_38790 [Achaetomium macrosporum]|uniref:Helicase ATP-binding domain-containing protein n=1 Tax=Achaetomium macrosporum TaxID=79813 RepID=A0AAN7H6X5_9PEZI|nr:hypothetical protein C8A03DRAFT_38790 [Achaetomium macrosporum]
MSEKAGEDNAMTKTSSTAKASDIDNTIMFEREGAGYRQSDDCPDCSRDEPLATQQAVPVHAKAAYKDITRGAENEDGNQDNDDRDGYRPEGEQEDAPTDSGDDADVQFLFERRSTLTGRDEAESGPDEDGPGSEADDNDAIPDEMNPLRDLRAVLHVTDDSEIWGRTCRFFCHDKARTAYDQGVKLLGTTLCLHPHQMDAVYALLQRSFGGHFNGGIVALDTGLGKTIVSLAAVAVIRLVELNHYEVRQEWSTTATDNAGVTMHRRHNPQGVTGPCPSGNPWSIECCCVADSFSSDIARQLGPGPSLVFTPSSVAGQFAQEAKRYFEQEVERPGSDNGQHSRQRFSFVDSLDLSTGSTLSRDIQSDILTHFLGARPVYALPKKGHQRTAPMLVPGSGSEMGYTANQAQRLFLRHRLVVVSSSPASLSSKGGNRNCFARAYDLAQQQRKSLRLYLASWAVAPRFVVLDEFHLVKRTSAVVYKTLQQLRSQAAPSSRFKLAALSATPISVSLQQSLKEVLSLIVPPDDLTAFYTAAQTIDAATKTGLPRDMDKYQEAMNTCSDLLGRVMSLRTTTDLFHGQVLLPLPPLRHERIPCRSARAQQDDFKRKMGLLTTAWSQEARAKFEKQTHATNAAMRDRFFQFARFNQSFMRTLWLGWFPGIVDLPDDISSDPAAWLNSNTIKGTITTNEGRDNHVVGQYIDVITRGSGKMEQLQRCLDRALHDVDMGDTGIAGQAPLKKHACVFASRPGVALIIAAYADKHWSSQWEVVLVLSAATADGKKAIEGAFRDIPIGCPAKPTLFIATVGTCGTGLDSLKKANHAILFDLPFVESDSKQACGRVWRPGQRFPCYWTELWAEDSEAETLINERHEKRTDAFRRILGHRGGDSSKAEGGGQ